MNEMNFDWNDLKFFLAVARHKGLSGTARQTGISPATLGRRMQALEHATGVVSINEGRKDAKRNDRSTSREFIIFTMVNEGKKAANSLYEDE